MECSSVHLCMCVYLKRVNGKLAFIPGFVCMGTLQNDCKFWGVSDQGLSFNTVLCGSQLNWTYKFMEIRVAWGSSGCRWCVKVQDCIPSSEEASLGPYHKYHLKTGWFCSLSLLIHWCVESIPVMILTCYLYYLILVQWKCLSSCPQWVQFNLNRTCRMHSELFLF